MPKSALLVLGNQLFDHPHLKSVPKDAVVFMREDTELCTYFQFHKQKIILFLSAMRSYADELRSWGFGVHYESLEGTTSSYEEALRRFIDQNQIKTVYFFEIEDLFFERRIFDCLKKAGVKIEILQSPMFLTSRLEFDSYLKATKKPFMKTFYEQQRKRLNILVDAKGKPEGGQWSFDVENRRSLPTDLLPPDIPKHSSSKHETAVKSLVEDRFAHHPGASGPLWIPTTREGAKSWLHCFLDERLEDFGPYEDALAPHSSFVFHSVLSPFLNTGLLTPQEVIEAALKRKSLVPMASLEGFVRQVIGWREFVRGIYRAYGTRQESSNFFNHQRELKPCWYDATTGIPPLDVTIRKVNRFAYAHHIERLMVVGSLMVLLEVHPKAAYRWFMEMFLDSSDWVMVPNVFGMALFSDGGIFATKPYVCGSNYYRKMGLYAQGDWCDGVDGLYWNFIDKQRAFFLRNPRLGMVVKTYDKMDAARKERITLAANALREKLTS